MGSNNAGFATRAARCVTLLSLILTILLGTDGCMKPPKPLAGTFQEVTVLQARTGNLTGQRVRWGGTIVSVTPGKNDTCLEILDRPLDARARPRRADQPDGRFVACALGFYDPGVYARGREVTVVGSVEKPVAGKIGDSEYTYSRVKAEQIYLWPEREPAPQPAYDYPFWPDAAWWWGQWPYGPWH